MGWKLRKTLTQRFHTDTEKGVYVGDVKIQDANVNTLRHVLIEYYIEEFDQWLIWIISMANLKKNLSGL